MAFILDVLDSGDVVVVLSQLLFIAQTVVPVTQLLVSGRQINVRRYEETFQCFIGLRNVFLVMLNLY